MALNKTGKNGHRDSVPVAATAAHVEEQGDEAARARTFPSPRDPATPTYLFISMQSQYPEVDVTSDFFTPFQWA